VPSPPEPGPDPWSASGTWGLSVKCAFERLEHVSGLGAGRRRKPNGVETLWKG